MDKTLKEKVILLSLLTFVFMFLTVKSNADTVEIDDIEETSIQAEELPAEEEVIDPDYNVSEEVSSSPEVYSYDE